MAAGSVSGRGLGSLVSSLFGSPPPREEGAAGDGQRMLRHGQGGGQGQSGGIGGSSSNSVFGGSTDSSGNISSSGGSSRFSGSLGGSHTPPPRLPLPPQAPAPTAESANAVLAEPRHAFPPYSHTGSLAPCLVVLEIVEEARLWEGVGGGLRVLAYRRLHPTQSRSITRCVGGCVLCMCARV